MIPKVEISVTQSALKQRITKPAECWSHSPSPTLLNLFSDYWLVSKASNCFDVKSTAHHRSENLKTYRTIEDESINNIYYDIRFYLKSLEILKPLITFMQLKNKMQKWELRCSFVYLYTYSLSLPVNCIHWGMRTRHAF